MGSSDELIIGGITISIAGLVFLIFIILFVLGGVLAIVLACVFTSRNKKHRAFVLEKSTLLKEVQEINKSFEFFNYKNYYKFSRHFDNKRSWYNTEPISVFTKQLRDNYLEWVGLKRRIQRNRELFEEYRQRIKGLHYSMTQSLCEKENMSYKKCKKIEHEEFDKVVLHPKIDIEFYVNLHYSSPKGQVQENKSKTFRYQDFVRVLDSVSQKRVDRETYEILAAGERSVLTDSLRYDILKRDGFRCVLCGMSSKDGAILHVDHIVPIAKGGRTEPSNLRTLCERCNLGKSDKLEQ